MAVFPPTLGSTQANRVAGVWTKRTNTLIAKQYLVHAHTWPKDIQITMWHKLESFLERLKLEFDAAAGAREDAAAEVKSENLERERAGFNVGVEADEL